jgi:hypothetical protein
MLVIIEYLPKKLYPTGYGNINTDSLEDKTVANEEKTEVSEDMLLRQLIRIEGQLRGIHK